MSSSTDSPPSPSLPPITRHITTHDPSGRAIFDTSLPLEVTSHRTAGFTTHTSFVNTQPSVSLSADADLASYRANLVESSLAPASGSVLRVVDFHPGFPAVMHRTASVDYGVVLEGEVLCVLDSGESRTLRRGDIIVQRGTMHAWKNVSGEVARVCFTLLPAPPVKVQGKELEVHDFSDFARLAEEYTY